MRKHWPTTTLCKPLALLLMATAFVLLFSTTTSPLYPALTGYTDSPMFQIIGKGWAEGIIPYTGLWDMKGPYIFLVNALGFMLTGNRMGVFLLQVVNLWAVCWIAFGLLRRHFSRSKSLLLLTISLCALCYTYDGGNLTEEYLLPFLMLSFSRIDLWIRQREANDKAIHAPLSAGIYGLTFALCLMTRATNALPLCGAVAVIAITLMIGRQWGNLWRNIGAFLVGTAIVLLPFMAYFQAREALPEMLRGTFFYPFIYAQHNMSTALSFGWHYLILSQIAPLAMLCAVIFDVVQSRRIALWSMVYGCAVVALEVWLLRGNGFAHYATVAWPLFVIALCRLFSLRKHLWAGVFIALAMVGMASKARVAWQSELLENPHTERYRQFIEEQLSPSQRTAMLGSRSFVAYNCDPNIYLALSATPAVRFFCLQDYNLKHIPTLREPTLEAFATVQPQFILVDEAGEKPLCISEILAQQYTIFARSEKAGMALYQLKKAP